ncbi:MAG: hypothetical protein ABIH26_06680 [Candidatus Eisenbacteria bacterium]
MGIRPNALRTAALCLALLLFVLPGCGKKGEKKGEGTAVLPDTLMSFREKIDWLIPRSFESLEYACQNKADQEIDAVINLQVFVPSAKFLSLFDGIDVKFRKFYYGYERFSSMFTVDPALPVDSTMALLKLEARSRLAEQVRFAEEQLENVTDSLQREGARVELEGLKKGLGHLDSLGVFLYGAEVKGYPEDLKGLMFRPEGFIRVIFPGVPEEGSWVRISPFYFSRMLRADQAAEEAREETK